MARHDRELAEVEGAVAHLSTEWRAVVVGYERARRAYDFARERYEEAQLRSTQARETYDAAAETWAGAARTWQLYQALVVIAAQMDAAALSGVSVCERTPTSSYRRKLEAEGTNITGKDVDHIVPRSLGGADHPSNYQVLPSSVNRAQGAWWGVDKCLSVGIPTCAAAIAVSVKCGSYSMLP